MFTCCICKNSMAENAHYEEKCCYSFLDTIILKSYLSNKDSSSLVIIFGGVVIQLQEFLLFWNVCHKKPFENIKLIDIKVQNKMNMF